MHSQRLAFNIRSVLHQPHLRSGAGAAEEDSLLGRPAILPTSTAGKTNHGLPVLRGTGVGTVPSTELARLNLKPAVHPMSVGVQCQYQSVSTGACEGDGAARLPEQPRRARALVCLLCVVVVLLVAAVVGAVALASRHRSDGGLATFSGGRGGRGERGANDAAAGAARGVAPASAVVRTVVEARGGGGLGGGLGGGRGGVRGGVAAK